MTKSILIALLIRDAIPVAIIVVLILILWGVIAFADVIDRLKRRDKKGASK